MKARLIFLLVLAAIMVATSARLAGAGSAGQTVTKVAARATAAAISYLRA